MLTRVHESYCICTNTRQKVMGNNLDVPVSQPVSAIMMCSLDRPAYIHLCPPGTQRCWDMHAACRLGEWVVLAWASLCGYIFDVVVRGALHLRPRKGSG